MAVALLMVGAVTGAAPVVVATPASTNAGKQENEKKHKKGNMQARKQAN